MAILCVCKSEARSTHCSHSWPPSWVSPFLLKFVCLEGLRKIVLYFASFHTRSMCWKCLDFHCQWIILFLIFTKNEIWCARLHSSVNLFRHSFQYHKKITVVKQILPNNHPSRPITPTPPPEQLPIRPSFSLFYFCSPPFFNIVYPVPNISVRTFCPLLARPLIKCTTIIEWNGLSGRKKLYNGIENMLMSVTLLRLLPELKVHWIDDTYCLYGCPNSRL